MGMCCLKISEEIRTRLAGGFVKVLEIVSNI